MPWQQVNPVSRVYTLPRCSLQLHLLSGDTSLGALQWTSVNTESLNVHEAFQEVTFQSTGMPWPEVKHINEIHELSWDGIWDVLSIIQPNTQYALVVTWRDANLANASQSTVTRRYVGVTTSSRDIRSRDNNEFTSSHVLRAKTHIADVVSNYVIPPP